MEFICQQRESVRHPETSSCSLSPAADLHMCSGRWFPLRESNLRPVAMGWRHLGDYTQSRGKPLSAAISSQWSVRRHFQGCTEKGKMANSLSVMNNCAWYCKHPLVWITQPRKEELKVQCKQTSDLLMVTKSFLFQIWTQNGDSPIRGKKWKRNVQRLKSTKTRGIIWSAHLIHFANSDGSSFPFFSSIQAGTQGSIFFLIKQKSDKNCLQSSLSSVDSSKVFGNLLWNKETEDGND